MRSTAAAAALIALVSAACGGGETADPAAGARSPSPSEAAAGVGFLDDDEADSYFNHGGLGYLRNANGVYGATEGCSWWWAGYGEDVYTVTDGSTGESLLLVVGIDEMVDGAAYEVHELGRDAYFSAAERPSPVLVHEGEWDLEDVDGQQRFRELLDDGSALHLARPEDTCDAPAYVGADAAIGSGGDDCGDFDCGESCETHASEYPDQCADWTESGRAPVYDESWFEDGMHGAYGVSGRWVYGAIDACQNPKTGGAEYVYQLVDGDSNNRIVLKIDVDSQSDVASFSFFREAEAQPYDTRDAAYELMNHDDHQRLVAQLGDEDVHVRVPTAAC